MDDPDKKDIYNFEINIRNFTLKSNILHVKTISDHQLIITDIPNSGSGTTINISGNEIFVNTICMWGESSFSYVVTDTQINNLKKDLKSIKIIFDE